MKKNVQIEKSVSLFYGRFAADNLGDMKLINSNWCV